VTRYVDSLVVTETGPGHCKDGQLNQDACLCSNGQYGRLIVVSDGLGSRTRASQGSKNACLAARDAVRYWSMNPLSPPERLAPLIQALWRSRIAPHPPEDCATTCILALRQRTGAWVIGGIGDGLAAIRLGRRELKYIIGGQRRGFLNETVGLGTSKSSNDWQFVTIPPPPAPTAAIIATDGVSDDLIPEKTGLFTAWLVDELRGLPARQRSQRLRAMLRKWPTPNHSDDKALGVIWESSSSRGRHE
jgi:hypothetical protein